MMSYDKQATAALIAASIMDELHPHILRAIAKALDGEVSKITSMPRPQIVKHTKTENLHPTVMVSGGEDVTDFVDLMASWSFVVGNRPTTIAELIGYSKAEYSDKFKSNNANHLYRLLVKIAGENGGINTRRLEWFVSRRSGIEVFGYTVKEHCSSGALKKWVVTRLSKEVAK